MISAALAILETDEQRNELSKFYEENKNKLFAVAFEYLHNKEEAEDAIQETFLRIADKPDKFFSLDSEQKVYYVCAIIKNVSIDMFKKRSKIIIEELTEDIVYQNDNSLLENTLLDKVSHDEMLSFITNLQPLQRNVLILTCLSELSISETAQTLNISEKAVNQRLYLARKSIKNFIKERGKSNE
jgi:RNA polymerase sigma-70 factor (ECF subfamily)